MDTYRKMRNDKLAEAMIKKLAARNIEGYYVQTKEEAKELALSLIPEGSDEEMAAFDIVEDENELEAVTKIFAELLEDVDLEV